MKFRLRSADLNAESLGLPVTVLVGDLLEDLLDGRVRGIGPRGDAFPAVSFYAPLS